MGKNIWRLGELLLKKAVRHFLYALYVCGVALHLSGNCIRLENILYTMDILNEISGNANNSSKKLKMLSVVFSFRNEEDVLSELIKRTMAVLKQEQANGILFCWELIFVNDASTDKSLDILLEQAKRHDDIRIINMSRCFGVSPCVLAGMEYSCGDAVIYMDADLQDPPDIIPEMIKAWQNGENIDVVHTIRNNRLGESRPKLLITKIGYFILRSISNINLPVEAGDFKLLSRRAVKHLIKLKEKKPFVRGLVCWIGFNQATVRFDRAPRFSGKTKFPVVSWKVISNFFDSALISFSDLPLKISSLIGLLGCSVSIIIGIHVFLEKLSGKAIPGWTAIMCAIIFFGSVQLITIGILGVYISSIFNEVKNRPNYIIESTFGFNQKNKDKEKKVSIEN